MMTSIASLLRRTTSLFLCLASACAGTAPDGAPPEESSTTQTESSGASSSSSSTSSSDDTAGTGDASGSTSGDATDTGTSTGTLPASCEGITPTTLFTTLENVGTPAGSFNLALLSWWDPATGDYDESADDFVVPEGTCWCVSAVALAWIYPGHDEPKQPELVVNFYDDIDEGPGRRRFSETTTAVTQSPFQGDENRYDITLAEPVLTPAGRTWMSVVEVVQDGERMGWRTSLDGVDTPHAQQLDLMDCPEFMPFEDCYPGEAPVQLAFEIVGAEVPCADP
ncbi:MAG: hypothetical protein IPH07_36370 [Deltaproteobacteria bacterium]|nr:hypothetical protein [Deltaproteobacteria bacterium]MBK8713295.1 hypothetical protein [Deltaproteobacteria bacterium]MBP7289360.1 hypothetical protein [Nannocystaceae bacterium]